MLRSREVPGTVRGLFGKGGGAWTILAPLGQEVNQKRGEICERAARPHVHTYLVRLLISLLCVSGACDPAFGRVSFYKNGRLASSTCVSEAELAGPLAPLAPGKRLVSAA